LFSSKDLRDNDTNASGVPRVLTQVDYINCP